MLRVFTVLIILLLGTQLISSQNLGFSPEITMGNRSTAYQHFIGYKINDYWSINNVTLYDTEYNNDDNNIFFVRNMVSYTVTKAIKTNFAFGVKNPGGFLTTTFQYQLNKPRFKVTYNVGSTYQNGFTLEQSLNLYYAVPISESTNLFTSLFTVFNTNLKYLDRGIQQFRIGIKKGRFQTGIAINLDQFEKAEKTLENFGISVKYNF